MQDFSEKRGRKAAPTAEQPSSQQHMQYTIARARSVRARKRELGHDLSPHTHRHQAQAQSRAPGWHQVIAIGLLTQGLGVPNPPKVCVRRTSTRPEHTHRGDVRCRAPHLASLGLPQLWPQLWPQHSSRSIGSMLRILTAFSRCTFPRFCGCLACQMSACDAVSLISHINSGYGRW